MRTSLTDPFRKMSLKQQLILLFFILVSPLIVLFGYANASKAEQEAAFNYIVFDYFSDAYLQSLEKNIQEFKAKGQFFVPPHMDYYKADSEFGKKVQALFAKYDNVYKYDEASNKLLDGKPEAQFGTQEYYAAMTNVIQEVF
jgi:multiple sugar transport system substrate-binding protein